MSSYIIWLGLLILSDGKQYFNIEYGNICYKNISKLKTVIEVTKEPNKVRTIRFCWNLPPRCSFYVTEFKDVIQEEKRIVSEEVAICCEGWKQKMDGESWECIPVCEEECHPFGICIQPNICLCNSGFNKSRCTKDDDYSTFVLHKTTTLEIITDPKEEPEKTFGYSTTLDHAGNYTVNYAGMEHHIVKSSMEGMVKIGSMDDPPVSATAQFVSIFTTEGSGFNNQPDAIRNKIKNVTNLATLLKKKVKPLNSRSILLIFLVIFISSFILTCCCLVIMNVCIRRQMNSYDVKKLSIKDLNKGESIFPPSQDGVLGNSSTTLDVRSEVLEDFEDILEKLEFSAAASDKADSQCCHLSTGN